ncbi:hypothetical protein A4S05_24525 [Nostoc sp. KVJ20]|nr:hypothetical protein A4S05_24525 [Nostoc sp. KVJ20]
MLEITPQIVIVVLEEMLVFIFMEIYLAYLIVMKDNAKNQRIKYKQRPTQLNVKNVGKLFIIIQMVTEIQFSLTA